MSKDSVDAQVMEPYGPVLETTMRVASWNTWSRFGGWEAREPVLLDVLRAEDPDIVCLQEAWEYGGDSQAERFGAALAMHHAMAPSEEYLGIPSGQAVLSRWPIAEFDSFKVGDKETVSGATFARIDGPRGAIDVISLILTWRLDHSHLRSAHLREILTWAREKDSRFHPLVVCGDFNATADSDELRAMVGLAPVHAPNMVFYDALTMRAEPPGYTFAERNPTAAVGLYPNKRLDHIFSHWPKPHGAGHPIAAAVIGDEPVDGVWASDHFGVRADLRY
ncbi:MAG: endonuclease/exonuclease/phosphatase family protein [Actinomycetota bacterium]